jgi:hypothetical protein
MIDTAKDVFAFAVAAAWFALNIVLWILVEAAIELFAWSAGLGTIYFAGFFAYLAHRNR